MSMPLYNVCPAEWVSKKNLRFLYLAEHVASWSKDPSTKTGCVIVRPDGTVASIGYNGFPRAIKDDVDLLQNREEKYKRTIHCEMNAILSARERLDGYTLFNWPGQSCERCAVHIIQAGIIRVVSPKIASDFSARWKEQTDLAEKLFAEAGVDYFYIEVKREKENNYT
jgi:dCMP deaminase